jgi:putative transcriptional regulator
VIKVNLKVLIAKWEQDTGGKLTYDRLAQRAGLAKNTIRRLAGQESSRLDLTTLDKLCKFFDCDVGDILYHVPDGGK